MQESMQATQATPAAQSPPARPAAAGGIEARKQRTRAAILAAAAALFASQGYEATTMQEIATLAEIGLGTVYGYVPSKEEMLRTVLDARRASAVQRSTEALRQISGAVERACLILRHLWEFLTENHELSLALLSLDTSRTGTRGTGHDGTYLALLTQLERGRREGTVAPIPLETTVKALLSTYTWAALQLGIWHNTQHPATVIDDLERLTLRLLKPDQA